MTESEELYLLRFRYGRAAEMLVAYNTFLYRQVNVGGKNICQNDEVVAQITHTLLITFYSFIQSMFDKSGTNFISATEQYASALTEQGKKIRNELIEIWTENEKAISKLRNNIGFHGGQKIKSHEVGYGALKEIHPQTAEFIMNHIALLFIEMDTILPPREDYKFHISPEQKKHLIDKAEILKNTIADPSFKKMVEELKKTYGN